jgi:hypothetical protein
VILLPVHCALACILVFFVVFICKSPSALLLSDRGPPTERPNSHLQWLVERPTLLSLHAMLQMTQNEDGESVKYLCATGEIGDKEQESLEWR